MAKSLTSNAILYTIRTTSVIIFPLITFTYASKILMPDNIGKVSFAQSVVGIFSMIASLGISNYAIRECSKVKCDKNELSKISCQMYSINLISTAISYVLVIIALFAVPKLHGYRLLILLASSSILFNTLGADWLNNVMEDFFFITIRTIVFQLISIVFLFLLVKEQQDYYFYTVVLLLSSSGSKIINILYRRKYLSLHFTRDIDLRKHFVPILAFFSMIVSVTIFEYADSSMLGLLTNDFQVGIYSTAHRVVQVVSYLTQGIIVVLLPRLSFYFKDMDYANINRLLKKILMFNISLGFPCIVGLFMISSDLICVLFGESFIDSANLLKVMLLSFLFSLFGGSFLGNAILLPSGQEKYYMKVCLITALTNVVLNAIFIPHYQAVAAAATTAFSGFLICVLLFVKVDKRIHLEDYFSIFTKPIIGCLSIIAVCYAFKLLPNIYFRLSGSIIVSIVLYSLSQFLLRNDLVSDGFSYLRKMSQKAHS